MDNDNALGQGINALIPPKNNNQEENQSFNINGLESRISQKVNQAFSNIPSREASIPSDFQDKIEKPFVDQKPVIKEEKEKIFHIETGLIKANPQQPRRAFSEEGIRELADSIGEYGIIEPLIASRIEKETDNGTEVEYQLIAGERRLRAAQLLELPTVPVIIKRPLSESRKLEMALVENIQREDLNPIARARAFARLMNEFNLTQQALAIKIGKSREVIANSLRLLHLPAEAQRMLEEGKINEAHARAVLSFSSPEKRRTFLREILVKNLSGREALLLAQKYLQFTSHKNNTSRRRNVSMDPQDLEWKEKLEEFFHVPVIIKKKGDSGEIGIKFFSQEEFQKILNKIINS